jgi:putative effector of murein hydrolase
LAFLPLALAGGAWHHRPMTDASGFSAYALADRVTRFFAVEHQTAMLLAVILAHAGRIRARRADSDEARQRIVAITLILCFVLVLWAIPWPWRAVGRPLLRASW